MMNYPPRLNGDDIMNKTFPFITLWPYKYSYKYS